MKRSVAFAVVIVVGLAVLIYSWTLGGWREFEVAGQRVRRHFVTRATQLYRDGQWSNSFEDDPRATPVTAETLKTVTLSDLAWGDQGLLIGRALTSNGVPVQGRLAINLQVREPNGTRVIGSGERSLRCAVDWPAGKGTWFVLDTGLTTPDPRQKTIVTLESLK